MLFIEKHGAKHLKYFSRCNFDAERSKKVKEFYSAHKEKLFLIAKDVLGYKERSSQKARSKTAQNSAYINVFLMMYLSYLNEVIGNKMKQN